MGNDFVEREEHRASIGRVHSRIDGTEKSVARQEVIVERIEKAVEKMADTFYGNGRDGMITKIGKLYTSVKIHFRLILVCLTGIIATAFFAIRSMLIK